ncbi:hypothetical protein COY62_04480 [bacterium (Candidatus Howlettbacteria) CG_4_10_14_0_8_um_filter_40_9]|nr:MAG: hypothetical protein COY62_04480 [bacterium (Candidatus Howlettbacteria) CG_4_10_14_0_8_um_filter_40_9]
MTKTTKILLIVFVVLSSLTAGLYGFAYFQSANQKKTQKSVATQPVTKDANEKELDSVQTDLNSAGTLDLTDLNNISSELDQINLNEIQ